MSLSFNNKFISLHKTTSFWQMPLWSSTTCRHFCPLELAIARKYVLSQCQNWRWVWKPTFRERQVDDIPSTKIIQGLSRLSQSLPLPYLSKGRVSWCGRCAKTRPCGAPLPPECCWGGLGGRGSLHPAWCGPEPSRSQGTASRNNNSASRGGR